MGLAVLGVVGIAGVIGFFGLSSAMYTIHEVEQAVVVQFGNPVREVTEAGLYFKIPMIQEVRRFDRRLHAWDGEPNEMPTAGGEFIYVDTTARWRIVEPQLFLESVGDESRARARLNDIIDSVVRDQIAGTDLVEIVRSSDWGAVPTQTIKTPVPDSVDDDASKDSEDEAEQLDLPDELAQAELQLERDELKALTEKVEMGRQELTRKILKKSRVMVEDYGIELIDVQIKRINYNEKVQEEAYRRMISDQQRRAERFRSEGQGQSARILGEARRELAEIRSEAERKAQIIRGEADAEATKIYNEAFSSDPEFYELYRTLESYHKTVNSKSTLLLGTDAEYYRYLRSASSK
ncbi:MAG: protease modulator HflC [Deltaproteobacteria bacterium]|nr:MAG: protease modulator HflC [Deltaproteobacteria bacterium]